MINLKISDSEKNTTEIPEMIATTTKMNRLKRLVW
jgi:hypothetical protein